MSVPPFGANRGLRRRRARPSCDAGGLVDVFIIEYIEYGHILTGALHASDQDDDHDGTPRRSAQ